MSVMITVEDLEKAFAEQIESHRTLKESEHCAFCAATCNAIAESKEVPMWAAREDPIGMLTGTTSMTNALKLFAMGVMLGIRAGVLAQSRLKEVSDLERVED